MRQTEHLVRLDGTHWRLWRDVALRGAGLPAVRIEPLCDRDLAAAADSTDEDTDYPAAFAAAADRLGAAVRAIAADPWFREAVLWQNRRLLADCLDKAAGGESRNARGRNHELTIGSYLQRYCLKNDTIGFFGPVGWARIDGGDQALTVRPGPSLLSGRTTYLERWAVEAVGAAILARPEVRGWQRPRLDPSVSVTGPVVTAPFRQPVVLSAAELATLARCDGETCLRDLVGDPPDPHLVDSFRTLQERGFLRLNLTGPPGPFPERALADGLDRIGDSEARARSVATLTELLDARDAVAAATGCPERLAAATGVLEDTFARLTGQPATRRAGQVYAARTVVYEDAVRDAAAVIGDRLLKPLTAPLSLLLDSALWLVNIIARRYETRARQLIDRARNENGRAAMPLLDLLAQLMPDLAALSTTGPRSDIVDEATEELQQRWQFVLETALGPDVLTGTGVCQVTSTAIAEGVARAFTTAEPSWALASFFSPDLMIAATDADALASGDVDVVLGELHCASNTLESELFAAQHPDPDRLTAAAAASGVDERVVILPRADWVTSRTSRSTTFMLPSFTYLCLGPDTIEPAAGVDVLCGVELVAEHRGQDIVVSHRAGGQELPFLEVIGEPLSLLAVDAFRPFAGPGHRPRVVIDRLVALRASWTFCAAELVWARVGNEPERFRQARRWRAEQGLPERVFLRVPVERKPVAVDFRSLTLVNLLAKSARQSAEAHPRNEITLTEMLPDLDQLWLTDHQDRRYTAELRVVAVHDRTVGRAGPEAARSAG